MLSRSIALVSRVAAACVRASAATHARSWVSNGHRPHVHVLLLRTLSTSTSTSGNGGNSAMTEEVIRRKLTDKLEAPFVYLEDTSGGCGAFYRLVIASPQFASLSLVKQHRLVKDVIADEIKGIHGLTIQTMTVAAYEEKRRQQQQQQQQQQK